MHFANLSSVLENFVQHSDNVLTAHPSKPPYNKQKKVSLSEDLRNLFGFTACVVVFSYPITQPRLVLAKVRRSKDHLVSSSMPGG